MTAGWQPVWGPDAEAPGRAPSASRRTAPTERSRTAGPLGVPPAPQTERGVASGLVAAGLLLLGVLVVVGVVLVAAQLTAHRVQGAADLVALTGAQARNTGRADPCAAARRAAAANDVEVLSCSTAGGEESFVVTVRVRGDAGTTLLGVPLHAQAMAHAGVP